MTRQTLALALALALCALGCDDGGDGDGGGGDMGVGQQTTALFGRITDLDGAPVAGARVTAAGATATTGADGRFQTRIGAGEHVVRVEADGYLPQIRAARVHDGEASALDARMMREAPAVPLDADTGGQADGARGARVIVPPGALVGPDGAPIAGMVDVHLTPLDPSVPAQLDAAPGDLTARDGGGATVKLVSYGMLDITMRQGGERLQVAPGQMMQIHIPAPMGAGDTPADMPLWSFDEATATWVEEGTLTYDAQSGTYAGEIGHMSYWNADRPQETACITGRVLDTDGDPVAGALVTSRGADYAGYDDTHAGPDGRFVVYGRVDSAVDVLASHGQGGVERTIQTTATVVGQPADPADCVDGGEWTIQRGVVQFSDGTVVDCDPAALVDFADCIPLMVELGECHSPMGTCTLDGGGLFTIDYSYSNGARVETEIDADTFAVTLNYYGPGGVACGRQTTNAQGAMGGQVTVELTDGRSASYTVAFDAATTEVTYTCADGSTRTLTADDQAALQACTGGVDDPANECEGDVGPDPSLGMMCETEDACGDGLTCCFGICQLENLCPTGSRPCEATAECDDGDVCCPATDRCLDRATCLQTGWCEGDADCDGGLCCDGACVDDRPTCQGACAGDADCGGETPYCCDRPDADGSYCATDAGACHAYQSCGADPSVCAGEVDGLPLVCCGEGDAADCRSTDECYGGGACGGVADCGGDAGGLICCDSDVNGNNATCATTDACYAGTPCGAASPCPGGLFCCERIQIDPELPGACLEDEGTCNLGQPCAGAADCGAGALCCGDAFLEEPICLQDDSGCMTPLP